MPQRKSELLVESLRDLNSRFRQREPKALADVHDIYGQLVSVVIARSVKDSAAVARLVEECFFRAWSGAQQLKNDVAFGPWLISIAQDCAFDYIDNHDGNYRASPMQEFPQATEAFLKDIFQEMAESEDHIINPAFYTRVGGHLKIAHRIGRLFKRITLSLPWLFVDRAPRTPRF